MHLENVVEVYKKMKEKTQNYYQIFGFIKEKQFMFVIIIRKMLIFAFLKCLLFCSHSSSTAISTQPTTSTKVIVLPPPFCEFIDYWRNYNFKSLGFRLHYSLICANGFDPTTLAEFKSFQTRIHLLSNGSKFKIELQVVIKTSPLWQIVNESLLVFKINKTT